jgi:hypothetical protein
MKTTFTILMLSACLGFISTWNKTNAQKPYDFNCSGLYCPVLEPGSPGSWDELWIFTPHAFIDEGTFYLFYTGFDASGIPSIGMAISTDGYTFTKYAGNPLLEHSASGFDSYSVSQGIVIEDPAGGWIMYYNGREIPDFAPGPFIGRATATNLTGPWNRSASPVLSTGSQGEWDEDVVTPNSLIPLDTGGFIMFYTGVNDITGYIQIGMATSPDGITWTKYNDPSTTEHPYMESDPVLKAGDSLVWDDWSAWECSVLKNSGYYEMYYSGSDHSANTESIGYAWSFDGIIWTKDSANPVYMYTDDPYAVLMGYTALTKPSVVPVFEDSIAFMYYYYNAFGAGLGMATADIGVGTNDKRFTKDNLRVTIYPNPVYQSAIFSYTLEESVQVKLEIFNSFGKSVVELLNCSQNKGEHHVSWNAETLPAGIYYVRLQVGEMVGSVNVVKVR